MPSGGGGGGADMQFSVGGRLDSVGRARAAHNLLKLFSSYMQVKHAKHRSCEVWPPPTNAWLNLKRRG